jgi:hypothetical protein
VMSFGVEYAFKEESRYISIFKKNI